MHRVQIGRTVASLLLGVVVGAAGTLMHRAVQPWGVVACLALVASAGLVARAWAGWPALGAYAVGVFAMTQALAQQGPGGDVLVPAGQAIGWVWVLGSVVVLLGVAAAPRGWFVDPAAAAPGPTAAADDVAS